MCDAIEGDHIMMIGDINGRVSAGGLAGVRCEPGLFKQCIFRCENKFQ